MQFKLLVNDSSQLLPIECKQCLGISIIFSRLLFQMQVWYRCDWETSFSKKEKKAQVKNTYHILFPDKGLVWMSRNNKKKCIGVPDPRLSMHSGRPGKGRRILCFPLTLVASRLYQAHVAPQSSSPHVLPVTKSLPHPVPRLIFFLLTPPGNCILGCVVCFQPNCRESSASSILYQSQPPQHSCIGTYDEQSC